MPIFLGEVSKYLSCRLINDFPFYTLFKKHPFLFKSINQGWKYWIGICIGRSFTVSKSRMSCITFEILTIDRYYMVYCVFGTSRSDTIYLMHMLSSNIWHCYQLFYFVSVHTVDLRKLIIETFSKSFLWIWNANLYSVIVVLL